MIKEISKEHISACVRVIKDSFLTVAKEFNITKQNAPRYVAFTTTEEKLTKQYDSGRKMFAYFDNDNIVGFYTLEFYGVECELNNLCVLPEYRHRGIAKELLKHSFNIAKQNGAAKMNISIVEENQVLKNWYIDFGFKTTHTEKYDFFPFTCGYMEKNLKEYYYSSVKNCINEIFDSNIKIIALKFVDYLNNNKMVFEKAVGYWENQQYFYVKYKGRIICYILFNGKDDETEFYPFTIWSDDSNSNWYCNADLDEHTKSIAIKHIDICENCGACSGGTQKQIFGNQYNNVCRTTFRFINPNIDELECLKKLVLLRKRDIDRG
ncbi:MAG: GNAT family N-acetyltransferase [Clostridium sp.]|nr:GNAT family N-acetyltransferase [Clostridium sp.]